jgi:hypothetical protein
MRLFPRRSLVVCVGAALIALGGTQMVDWTGARAASPQAEAPIETSPFSTYEQPTGPELSAEAVRAIALNVAENAGDSNPVSISVIHTTFADAAQAANPDLVLPSPSSSGEANFQQSSVDLLVLHGQFKLNAPTPQGRPDPSGTVLMLAVDAYTGRIDYRGVDMAEPAGLSALGAATALR